MRRYRLTVPADRDMWNILARIDDASPAARERMYRRFVQAFERLGRFPKSGHVRTDLTDRPVRFQAVGNYLVVYDPARKPVLILRILHAAMDVARELRLTAPED